MRIAHHPATIVEIYADGRMEMFFAEPVFPLDTFKIRLIMNVLRNRKSMLVETSLPGAYRFYLSNYSWNQQKTKYVFLKV